MSVGPQPYCDACHADQESELLKCPCQTCKIKHYHFLCNYCMLLSYEKAQCAMKMDIRQSDTPYIPADGNPPPVCCCRTEAGTCVCWAKPLPPPNYSNCEMACPQC